MYILDLDVINWQPGKQLLELPRFHPAARYKCIFKSTGVNEYKKEWKLSVFCYISLFPACDTCFDMIVDISMTCSKQIIYPIM